MGKMLLLLAMLALPSWAGPILHVRDVQGRALEIELLALNGDNVRIRRVDNAKEFTVAMDLFDEPSRAKIRKEAADLPAPLPPLDVEVVIGKRRTKGDSYYMVTQTISCTVKLRNRSHDIPLPGLTGRVLFIGRNQRVPDAYTVLAVQDFKVGLNPGESSATPLESFVTHYDSDNKGYGNIGGYQYSGYLLVLLNDKREVAFNQTTDALIRRAVDGRPGLLAKFADYSKGAYLDVKMEQRDEAMKPPEVSRF